MRAPQATLPGASVSLRWAGSYNRTRTQYHLIFPEGASGEEPLPTLMTCP
jgi:prolyl oligopeptidase